MTNSLVWNTKQVVTLSMGILVTILTILFPPFDVLGKMVFGTYLPVYAPVWHRPVGLYPEPEYQPGVLTWLLFVQIGLVGFVTATTMFFLRERPDSSVLKAIKQATNHTSGNEDL